MLRGALAPARLGSSRALVALPQRASYAETRLIAQNFPQKRIDNLPASRKGRPGRQPYEPGCSKRGARGEEVSPSAGFAPRLEVVALRGHPIMRLPIRSLLAASFIALTTLACKKEDEQKAAAPAPVFPVKVAEAVVRDVPIYIEAVGQTRGHEEIEISARVEGFLETMNFKEGTFVK